MTSFGWFHSKDQAEGSEYKRQHVTRYFANSVASQRDTNLKKSKTHFNSYATERFSVCCSISSVHVGFRSRILPGSQPVVFKRYSSILMVYPCRIRSRAVSKCSPMKAAGWHQATWALSWITRQQARLQPNKNIFLTSTIVSGIIWWNLSQLFKRVINLF